MYTLAETASELALILYRDKGSGYGQRRRAVCLRLRPAPFLYHFPVELFIHAEKTVAGRPADGTLENALQKQDRHFRFAYTSRLLLRAEGCAAVLSIVLAAACTLAAGQSSKPAPQSTLELSSSDARLVEAFDWAKQQAMAYVFDGDPVGPWYEASLPGRRAFCMRDTAHQAAGAAALGLSAYTHNMLHRFAENIAESRDWCSYWEINDRNLPAPVDYQNDKVFWYNLPANFDVLDACYRMYLWTGDRSYIEDPVFLNFYDRTVTDYVSRWDLNVHRIMTRKNTASPPPFFRGDPSYEESRRDMELGVDLLAAQYAGYRSYAAIQAIRGKRGDAATYLQSASEVKALVNSQWWNGPESYFYSYLDDTRKFQGRGGADLLYRNVAEDGPHTKSALHALIDKAHTEPTSAVEPKSHYAEILYHFGDAEDAYAQILDLTHTGRERREYPEVSYSVIGALVNGMMGINVKTGGTTEDVIHGSRFDAVVETLPQLTAKTSWVELRNLPVLGGSITVKEDGHSTAFTNHGKNALVWRAAFSGSYATLVVNGKSQAAQTETRSLDHVVSWVRVPVAAGASAKVETPR